MIYGGAVTASDTVAGTNSTSVPTAWPRPRLVVSACLELESCRYDGQRIRARFVHRLLEHADLIPVLQPVNDLDVTDRMPAFADSFLMGIGAVDGFLLKSRSPSRVPRGVKAYGEGGGPRSEKHPGLFAAAAAARYPSLPLEDEGRLTNYQLRSHFLTRLFLTARLRELPETMAAIVGFHAANKLLLLACSEIDARSLGRIVANPTKDPPGVVKRRYHRAYAAAIAHHPRPGPIVNAMMHAFGHLSTDLLPAERSVFLEVVEGYRLRRLPLEAPMALIRGWNARQRRAWLEEQTLLRPYPDALHDLADSAGDGRAT